MGNIFSFTSHEKAAESDASTPVETTTNSAAFEDMLQVVGHLETKLDKKLPAYSGSDIFSTRISASSTASFSSKTASITKYEIVSDEATYVGRDDEDGTLRCSQSSFAGQHFKLYTVIHENKREQMAPCVFMENLAASGTEHNGRWFGPGQIMLLIDKDELRPCFKGAKTLVFRDNDDLWPKQSHWSQSQHEQTNVFRAEYQVSKRLIGTTADDKIFNARRAWFKKPASCKVVDLSRIRRHEQGRIKKTIGTSQESRDRLAQRVKQSGKTYSQYFESQIQAAVEKPVQRLEAETGLLREIHHPNIIRLMGSFRLTDYLYGFQEFVTGGTLAQYIEPVGRLGEDEARVVVLQIVKALQHLHSKGVVHAEMKVDNILIDMARGVPRVVLCDFGSATRDGLAAAKSPSDMWALGTVACTILTGAAPFETPADPNTKTGLQKLRKSSEISAEAKDFMGKLLRLTGRMRADEAAEHPWLRQEPFRAEFEDAYARLVSARRNEPLPRPPEYAKVLVKGKCQRPPRTDKKKPIEAHYMPAHKKVLKRLHRELDEGEARDDLPPECDEWTGPLNKKNCKSALGLFNVTPPLSPRRVTPSMSRTASPAPVNGTKTTPSRSTSASPVPVNGAKTTPVTVAASPKPAELQQQAANGQRNGTSPSPSRKRGWNEEDGEVGGVESQVLKRLRTGWEAAVADALSNTKSVPAANSEEKQEKKEEEQKGKLEEKGKEMEVEASPTARKRRVDEVEEVENGGEAAPASKRQKMEERKRDSRARA